MEKQKFNFSTKQQHLKCRTYGHTFKKKKLLVYHVKFSYSLVTWDIHSPASRHSLNEPESFMESTKKPRCFTVTQKGKLTRTWTYNKVKNNCEVSF